MVLVNVELPGVEDPVNEANEFKLLCLSAGARIVDVVHSRCRQVEAKYFIGTGKAEQLRQVVLATSAEVVIINHDISPAQERNLEKLFACRVLDRTGLILDIFAARAKSHEGKLQVELAQLRHLSTRLVRGWSHLERQKGGIGLRGPGETQLESDRRMIATRIKSIRRKLVKVAKTRQLGRRARKRASLATVALVGYTNAGKSTLFNVLVNSRVYAAGQLFATLDTTLRKFKASKHVELVLADTVGFISRLPHDLIDAFKSTLEETLQADLLLHVIDAANENYHEQKLKVYEVLRSIGAGDIPVLEVMNKTDLVSGISPGIDNNDTNNDLPQRVWLSSKKCEGLEFLTATLDKYFQTRVLHCCMSLSPKDGDIRSVLYEKADIISEFYDKHGRCQLELKLEQGVYDNLHGREACG